MKISFAEAERLQEIGLLKGLEAEIVVAQVPLVVHGLVQLLGVLLHEAEDLLREQGCRPALRVGVAVEQAAGLVEGVRRVPDLDPYIMYTFRSIINK